MSSNILFVQGGYYFGSLPRRKSKSICKKNGNEYIPIAYFKDENEFEKLVDWIVSLVTELAQKKRES